MADITLSSYISLRKSKFSGFNIKKLISQPEKIKTNNTHIVAMQAINKSMDKCAKYIKPE